MKVRVTRSGGFAGLTESLGEFDSVTLPPEDARQLRQWVQQCDFFALPAEIQSTGVGADLYRYEVAVSDENRSHSVSFRDDESPLTQPLMSLVHWAEKFAKAP